MAEKKEPGGNRDINFNVGVSAGISPRAQKMIAGILALIITGGGGTSLVVAYDNLNKKYLQLSEKVEAENKVLKEEMGQVKKENAECRHLLTDVGALIEKTARSVKSPALRRELEAQAKKIKDKTKPISQVLPPIRATQSSLPAPIHQEE